MSELAGSDAPGTGDSAGAGAGDRAPRDRAPGARDRAAGVGGTDPLAGFRPDHAGISVADLEASVAWYRDILGFTIDRIVDIPEDTGRLALLRNGDFLLELFCLPDAAPIPEERRHPATDLRTHGMKHVAYAVADIRALMEHLKAKGVDVVWDVVLHDDTMCAFVRDNSGNVVEFLER